MSDSHHCPTCRTPLSAVDAPCPRCLLSLPLASRDQEPLGAGFWDDMPSDPVETLAAPEPRELTGSVIGPYKLRERLGEGGCGVVYVADQEIPMRRRVALKVIKWGMDTRQVVARFEAERQALAMMDHPNIARVLDAGTTEAGRPFFVMELVRGIRITDYCDKHQLDTQARLRLFMSVCQAVQHAHQKGIIHRDLKPSNILVTLHDGIPVPKVIDFGIAKAIEGKLSDLTVYTELHHFMGTPAYMSPEQAEMSGLDIDTRSDVYSLGVLLYELLTGKPPFDSRELTAAGLDAMRQTIREKEPARPSTRLATLARDELTTTAKRRSTESPKLIQLIRGDLDWIVMKCLEKDRTRRYDTANGLAADVRRHLESEPVIARPPSSIYKCSKFVRRNRIGAVASLVVVLAIMIGFSMTLSGLRAERKARQMAESGRREAESARTSEARQREVAESNLRLAEERDAHLRRLAYAFDMKLAAQALEQGAVGTARACLARQRPAVGQEDLRGWEWRYLWQQARGDTVGVLTNVPSGVNSMCFSADETRLAIGSRDGTVQLWDVEKRRLERMFQAGRGPVTIATSPSDQLFGCACDSEGDSTCTLSLVSSGGEDRVSFPLDAVGRVHDLVFFCDGQTIGIALARPETVDDGKTSSAKPVISILTVAIPSGQILSRFVHLPTQETCEIDRLRLELDSGLFWLGWSATRGTSSLDGEAHSGIYSIETGQLQWQAPDANRYTTVGDLSADGKWVAHRSGPDGSVLDVRELTTGLLVTNVLLGEHWIGSVHFLAGGSKIIVLREATSRLHGPHTIHLYDAATGQELAGWKVRAGLNLSGGVAAIRDGRRVVTSSRTGDVLLFQAGYHPTQSLQRTNSSARFVILPNSLYAESSTDFKHDSPMRIGRLDSLDPPVEIDSVVARFKFDPNANWLFTWNSLNQLRLWKRRLSSFQPVFAELSISQPLWVAISTDGLFAWTLRGTNAIQIFDASRSTRREVTNRLLAEPWPVGFLDQTKLLLDDHVVSSEGRSRPGFLRVFDLVTEQEVWTSPDRVLDWVSSGKWSFQPPTTIAPDRKRFVWVTEGRAFRLTEAGTGSTVELATNWAPMSAEFSPDGRVVATMDGEGSLKAWDLLSRRMVSSFRAGFDLSNLEFSPDGARLVTSGDSEGQEPAKIWDWRSGAELLSLAIPDRGQGDGGRLHLNHAKFEPHGATLFIPGDSGIEFQFSVPSWEEIRQIEEREGPWRSDE